MKIGILSREVKNYSTTRLKVAAEKRGHTVKVLNTLKFSIHVAQNKPRLYYKNKPLPRYDAIIPRIGASITFFGTAVLRQFEQMGVYTANSSLSISISRDKLRATQILSRHNLGIPGTIFVKDKEAILPSIESIPGDDPVVIKLLEGTQGIGVILADSKKVAEAIIETLQSTKQNVLIQEFIKESKGRDIRAFVVGGKVVAAMRRVAKGDEFRSNVHRGGTVEPVKLTEEYEETAVKAAQIMGLGVAGVDMLEGKKGPKIMEVNSSPGLEGIEKASKVDIASKIIEHIEHQVLFPEVDIRQRLTLKSGYGIAEIPIERKSAFDGKTIAETGIRDKDVLVLTLTRGKIVIPNPKGSRHILGGDVLLCFGNMETLKSIIPIKKKRGRKKKA